MFPLNFSPQAGEQEDGPTNYASVTGTIGRAGLPSIPGANDMMTEMAKRLRERRAKAEGLQTVGT